MIGDSLWKCVFGLYDIDRYFAQSGLPDPVD